MSIKYKLFVAFLLATVLPATAVILIYHLKVSDMMIERDTKQALSESLHKMGNINRSFSQIEGVLLNFSSDPGVLVYLQRVSEQNYNDEYESKLLSEMAAKLDSVKLFFKDVESIYILPSNEAVPLHRGYEAVPFDGDYEDDPVYRRSISGPERIYWTLAMANGGKRPVLYISKGIIDPYSGDVLGVVSIHMGLANLFENLEEENLSGGETFFITDETKQIRYVSKGNTLELPVLQELIADPVRESTGSFLKAVDGLDYVVTYTTSYVNEWKIYHTVPSSTILDGIRQISGLTWMFAAVFILFAVGAALYVFILLYRPVRRLIRAMRGIEGGNLDLEIDPVSRDEFGMMIRTFNYLIKRVKQLLFDVTENEKKKTVLTIQALQAQIMPHFLYNTLNTVLSMARLGNTQAIIDMNRSLIDLLKISASNKSDRILIREELHYVKGYIKIMSYRYDMPIQVDYDVDPGLEKCQILKFTFQPIVENSIFHAFEGFQGPLQLRIRIQLEGETVIAEISDNGIGIDDATVRSILQPASQEGGRHRANRMTGIGLANVDERYRLEFGTAYGLRIESALGEGTRVTVLFPRTEVREENVI